MKKSFLIAMFVMFSAANSYACSVGVDCAMPQDVKLSCMAGVDCGATEEQNTEVACIPNVDCGAAEGLEMQLACTVDVDCNHLDETLNQFKIA